MKIFEEGDKVRIDIPDKDDPDHDQLHGEQGTITGILEDNAGDVTGDPRDSYLFSVEIDGSTVKDFRWRDLRPAQDT
jgi:ribosomal protein L21E